MRTLRFGLALPNSLTDDPVPLALEAERRGFDVAVIGDHVGPELAPMPTLAAIASCTESIRIGTMVLNADVRHPVQLAWEAATLSRLSGGRFELGLGAGHTPQEYAALGLPLRRPVVRKRRLGELVGLVRRLLDGEVVTTRGEFFDVADAQVSDAPLPVPILVGGNGAALLEHAGRYADAIGLAGLGRTRPDGHSHTVRWHREHLEQQLDQIRRGAALRQRPPELSALVQIVQVTGDAETAVAALCERVPGLTPAVVADAPYVLIGTVEEIAAKVLACQARWDISYFVVRDLEGFAPVIAHIRNVISTDGGGPPAGASVGFATS